MENRIPSIKDIDVSAALTAIANQYISVVDWPRYDQAMLDAGYIRCQGPKRTFWRRGRRWTGVRPDLKSFPSNGGTTHYGD